MKVFLISIVKSRGFIIELYHTFKVSLSTRSNDLYIHIVLKEVRIINIAHNSVIISVSRMILSYEGSTLRYTLHSMLDYL